MAIIRNLESTDFNLLYSGRIALDDLPYIASSLRDIVVPPAHLPHFLDDLVWYKEQLRRIGKVNGIEIAPPAADTNTRKEYVKNND